MAASLLAVTRDFGVAMEFAAHDVQRLFARLQLVIVQGRNL